MLDSEGVAVPDFMFDMEEDRHFIVDLFGEAWSEAHGSMGCEWTRETAIRPEGLEVVSVYRFGNGNVLAIRELSGIPPEVRLFCADEDAALAQEAIADAVLVYRLGREGRPFNLPATAH